MQLLGPVRLFFLKFFPDCALIRPCALIRETRVRFIWLICRIVDFSSLLIIEVIAKNVKIKKNPF